MNELLGLVDLVLCVGHDQTMQVFLLVAGMGSIRATLAFLDGALSTNRNLGARFSLHFLESVATGPNKQANFSRELSVSECIKGVKKMVGLEFNSISLQDIASRQVAGLMLGSVPGGRRGGRGWKVVMEVRGLVIILKLISG